MRQQRAKAADAALRNVATDRLTRDYRLLVTARGGLENTALRQLRALLFDVRLWTLVTASGMFNWPRAQTFLMISAVGALIEKHLRKPHSLPPWITFLILDDPAYLEILLAILRCLWDAFTLGFADVDMASAYFAGSSPEAFTRKRVRNSLSW